MRPAGGESGLKTTVNHETRNDCVSEGPQTRDKAGCTWVEPGVAIEFTGELKPAMKGARKGEIELIILIKAEAVFAADQEARQVEIKMEMCDVLARQESKSVIHAARSQSALRAGRRYFDGVGEG